MNMLKIDETAALSVATAGPASAGVVGLLLHRHQNHSHHHHHHNHHQIGGSHLHHHHDVSHLQHPADTSEGSNGSAGRGRLLQHHHPHHHIPHHLHGSSGTVDQDDDGDEVLPEVNFNAADEFNLKFFDTSNVVENACFSGDEAGGPASVDSNGIGVGVGADCRSVSGSPLPLAAATASSTAIGTEVLHMVTTDSADELGDWMHSFVQEQQQQQHQQEPNCSVRTASDYVMGVKDDMYGGRGCNGGNINNNSEVSECGNGHQHDGMDAVCDSRGVRIQADCSSTGGIFCNS